MPEERIHLGAGAEAGDAEACELPLIPLAAPRRVSNGEGKERVATPERRAQAFAIAVPELLARDDATGRATGETRKPDVPRQVEPDDSVRRLEHEVPELRLIGAVHHPRVSRHQRLHSAAKSLRRELGPACLMVQRVQLHERHTEPGRERTSEGGLAASACGGDDRNASHEETIRSAPPGIVRCT